MPQPPKKKKVLDAKDYNPGAYGSKGKKKKTLDAKDYKVMPYNLNKPSGKIKNMPAIKGKGGKIAPMTRSPRVAEMAVANSPRSARAIEGSAGYAKPKKKSVVSPRVAERRTGAGMDAKDRNPNAFKGIQPKSKPKTGLDNNPRGRYVKPKAVKQANVYMVKKGDSLWAIAQKKGTTVANLMKLNPQLRKRDKAGGVVLYSGTKVRVPGKTGGAGRSRVK